MQSLPTQDAALQQLSTVPGVVGSLVFGQGGEVLASQFPPVFDAQGLGRLAAQLADDAYFREWIAGEDGTLELRYGDGAVQVRSMDGSWLLVLCTTQANPQLLSMSLTQVVRRLRLSPPAQRAAREQPGPSHGQPSARDRLRAVVEAELGAHAPQALEILAAAGDAPADLRRAADDIEKLTKLFISTKKAGGIARKMKLILGG